jgi:hypothetical protein
MSSGIGLASAHAAVVNIAANIAKTAAKEAALVNAIARYSQPFFDLFSRG